MKEDIFREKDELYDNLSFYTDETLFIRCVFS